MGVACGARRNALRRLRPDHRGSPAACARRGGSGRERRHPPRTRGMGPATGAPVAVDGRGPEGRLPRAACPGCAGAGAAPAREPQGAVALAGGGFLHDAGHDVRMACLPSHARRPDHGNGTTAALGLLGHQPAGGAVRLRAILLQRAARYPAAAGQHGSARGAGHAHHLRGQHGGHVRSDRPLWPRGLLRLADHVRLFPAHGPLAGAAPARSHGRGAGSGDEPVARQRGAAGGRR